MHVGLDRHLLHQIAVQSEAYSCLGFKRLYMDIRSVFSESVFNKGIDKLYNGGVVYTLVRVFKLRLHKRLVGVVLLVDVVHHVAYGIL